jgi:hypothetical protein
MNLIEIKEKYPLAWIEIIKPDKDNVILKDFGFEVYEEMEMASMEVFPRSMYDLFDELGIMIEVGVDHTRAEYGKPLFCYKVLVFNHPEDQNNNWSVLYRSRPEAEEEAFKKAFEILNKLLCQGLLKNQK